MSLRFPLTIFLSAFLLFQVQPLMGRYILPWFGGTPAVWGVCLLFFQVILLAGYAYAHWLGSRKNGPLIHIGLLLASFLLLPIEPNAIWKPDSSSAPAAHILLLLLVTVGGPYFILSSTTPLLQRWYSLTEAGKAGWRLYALSNFGSFLALFSYPFLMEPYARLRTQSWIWSSLYAVFVAICAFTAWQARKITAQPPNRDRQGADEARPSPLVILFWLALAATASTLLIATTNLITQDIVGAPFLWIMPLSIYLLSFILTFESDRWYRRMLFAILAGVLAPIGATFTGAGVYFPIWVEASVYLAALFAACMVCHGELSLARPASRYLTAFYLTVSAGGVLGGVFVALIAPQVFREYTEYPLGLMATCVLGFTGWMRMGAYRRWTSGNFGVRIPLIALMIGSLGCLYQITRTAKDVQIRSITRNFFGILWVTERHDSTGDFMQLAHGRTKHGTQYLSGPLHNQATTYFGAHGGAGLVMQALSQPNRNVAIIGLGTGTMAAWGRPGDTFRFYEINPVVEGLANQYFTYLKDSKAKIEIAVGDARIQMERELESGPRTDFDLIVVDAFSSDAIPMHLLTAESADIYKRRLKPGGMILMHISNRTLNLEPVVRGLAKHLNWRAAQFLSSGYEPAGEDGSRWILLTPNPDWPREAGIENLVSGWSASEPILWTDDFASLWHILMW